jgi:hypothetical protein
MQVPVYGTRLMWLSLYQPSKGYPNYICAILMSAIRIISVLFPNSCASTSHSSSLYFPWDDFPCFYHHKLVTSASEVDVYLYTYIYIMYIYIIYIYTYYILYVYIHIIYYIYTYYIHDFPRSRMVLAIFVVTRTMGHRTDIYVIPVIPRFLSGYIPIFSAISQMNSYDACLNSHHLDDYLLPMIIPMISV